MKIMKRKMAAFVMFFAFLICLLGVCVGAEESIYAENIKAINDSVYTLSGVMDGYAEADRSEEKEVAIRTNSVILRYVNMINSLRADSRVSSEDLHA
jgi:outer membrane lipoprotein-sorting protein